MMGHIRQLMQSIGRVLRTWYQVDRIRVAPADGRLLHLDVGDCFVVGEECYRVVQRQVQSDDTDCRVDLSLRSHQGCARLQIFRPQLSQPTQAQLICGDQQTWVFDGDVMIVPSDAAPLEEEPFPSLDNQLPAFRVP